MDELAKIGFTKTWDDEGLTFQLDLGDRSVSCWISRSALEALSSYQIEDRHQLRLAFDVHSDRILEVAAPRASVVPKNAFYVVPLREADFR